MKLGFFIARVVNEIGFCSRVMWDLVSEQACRYCYSCSFDSVELRESFSSKLPFIRIVLYLSCLKKVRYLEPAAPPLVVS